MQRVAVGFAFGWDVEIALWGDGAVVTRSGGLAKGLRGHNWCVLYFTYA